MSRRKMMLFASLLAVVAVSAGVYVPDYFSPLPGLVDEMRSCLEVAEDEPGALVAAGEPSQQILIEMCLFGLNCTKCRKTLLADDTEFGRVVHGVVKEKERFRKLRDRLGEENCLCVYTQPTCLTMHGRSATSFAGSMLSRLSAVDGVSVVTDEYGTRIEVVPTLHEDGRIHLQVGVAPLPPCFLVERKAEESNPPLSGSSG